MRAAKIALLALASLAAVPAFADSPTLETTPNLETPLSTGLRSTDFVFTHRFSFAGTKLFNSPTFTLNHGVLSWLEVGIRYASNSDVVASRFNEFEAHVRFSLLEQERRGQPLDLALIAAYNTSARSADGGLVIARRFGPVELLGNARVFSNGYDGGGATFAAGAGAQVILNRNLRLQGDINRLLAAQHVGAIDLFSRWAWSGGIVFLIPYSPHTLALYATNGNTHTLEGMSRGTDRLFVGFTFDVPLGALARWAAIFVPHGAAADAQSQKPVASEPNARVVEVVIDNYAFQPAELQIAPNTTVRFVNRDNVPHTATAESGAWDSGVIPPGGSWSHTFDQAGTWKYLCTIHPFMRATVVAR